MKPYLYLISLSVLGMSLVSCEQGERIEKTADKNSVVYEEAFVKTIGDYSGANTWNTAGQFSLDIHPGPDGIVKIYAPCMDGFRLVARYDRALSSFTSNFDAPATSAYFVVALGEDLFYADPDGRVTADSRRADDVKVSDEPFQWILAVENDFDAREKSKRHARNIDFDFNDLLIGITAVATDDGVSLDFSPLACGDNQPFYLHIHTNDKDQLLWQANNGMSDDCEFHQWFGIKDYTTAVNTGTNSASQITGSGAIPSIEAITAAMSGCHLTLPFFSLSNFSFLGHDYKGNPTDIWGIYVTVGTYKGFDYVKNNSDYGLICSEGPGSAPHMLLFPDTGYLGKWQWPCEGNSLGDCYPVFRDWVNMPFQEQYMAWNEWKNTPGLVRERY